MLACVASKDKTRSLPPSSWMLRLLCCLSYEQGRPTSEMSEDHCHSLCLWACKTKKFHKCNVDFNSRRTHEPPEVAGHRNDWAKHKRKWRPQGISPWWWAWNVDAGRLLELFPTCFHPMYCLNCTKKQKRTSHNFQTHGRKIQQPVSPARFMLKSLGFPHGGVRRGWQVLTLLNEKFNLAPAFHQHIYALRCLDRNVGKVWVACVEFHKGCNEARVGLFHCV